jgi:hypothetical protein
VTASSLLSWRTALLALLGTRKSAHALNAGRSGEPKRLPQRYRLTKQSFGAWGDVFGDRVIATAILDRVLHHAITLNIRGNSYRLKEKLKAGLIRSYESATAIN